MFLRVMTGWALVCGSLLTSVGWAQNPPLDLFTENVDVIVRLREPDQTVEKLIKVVNRIQPGVGDALQAQKSIALGTLISNPSLTGVDESRDWYVGVYGEKNAPPTVVFAIPVTNATDFVSALNGTFQSKVNKNWVIYTDADALPEAGGVTASAKLTDVVKTRLATGDLTVYIDTAHLTVVYAEQIELFKEKILETLNNLPNSLPPQGNIDMAAVMQMYAGLVDSTFQMLGDTQVSSYSLSFSESEIGLNEFIEFKADSPSARFLESNPQSKFDRFSQLPANWPLYVGFSGDSAAFMEWGMSYSAQMFGLEGDQKAAVEEILKDAAGLRYGPTITAMDLAESATAAMRGVTLQEASPIDQLKALTRKSQSALGVISSPGFSQETTLQEDAETFGALKADLVHVKQTQGEEADPTGAGQKVLDLLAGENGMETRVVYLNDLSVGTVGGGRKLMEDTLKGIEANKANRTLTKARASLMPEANVVVLLDLPGLVGRGLKVASKVEGVPLMVNAAAIDGLGLGPSYMAFSFGSEKNTYKGQYRIPMEQITGLTKLGVLIGASMRPGL